MPTETGWRHPVGRLSAGSAVLAGIAAATVWAVWHLAGVPGQFLITEGGLDIAQRILFRAVTPALTYESPVPD